MYYDDINALLEEAMIKEAAAEELLAESEELYKLAQLGELLGIPAAEVLSRARQETVPITQLVGYETRLTPSVTQRMRAALARLIRAKAFLPTAVGLGALGLGAGAGYLAARPRKR